MAPSPLKEICLYRYGRTFKTGEKRRGLLLKLTTYQGTKGWGEIAPLPSFSQETTAQAEEELKQKLFPLLAKNPLPMSAVKRALLSCYPSVQFGVESALLDLTVKHAPLPPLPLSRLIQGSITDICLALQTTSFSTVKLKLTSFSPKELHLLLNALPPHLKLRIDANCRFTLDQALFIAKILPPKQIDYYEEPLKLTSDLPSFPHPIGLDETARLNPLTSYPNLKAIIIKPTLSGGLTKLKPLASFCRKKKIDFILSSSYESEIGIAQIAKLHSQLALPLKPVGLDTCRYFSAPLTTGPLIIREEHLFLRAEWSLNKELIDGCFRMSL